MSEAGTTETGKSKTGTSETGTSETGTSETGTFETGTTKTGTSEVYNGHFRIKLTRKQQFSTRKKLVEFILILCERGRAISDIRCD